MKYWLVLIIYILFAGFISYSPLAQGCSKSEKEVMTGAACSIKDLPKIEEKDKVQNIKNKPYKKIMKKNLKQNNPQND